MGIVPGGPGKAISGPPSSNSERGGALPCDGARGVHRERAQPVVLVGHAAHDAARVARHDRVADARAELPARRVVAEDGGRAVGVHLGRGEHDRVPGLRGLEDGLEQPLVVGLLTRRRGLGELDVVGDHPRAVAHELVDHLRVPAARERPLLADAALRRASGTSSRRRRPRRRRSAHPASRGREARVDRLELQPLDAPAAFRASVPAIAASVAIVSRIRPAAPARRDTQPRRRHARRPAAAAHRRGGVLSLTRGVQVRYSRTPFSVSPLLSVRLIRTRMRCFGRPRRSTRTFGFAPRARGRACR